MSDVDLSLEGLSEEEAMSVIGGVCTFQMQALAARDVEKVNAAGGTLLKLVEQNPERVREVFLRNNDAFRVGQMPDEVLEQLDLEVRDGRLYEPDGEDGWTEVEIDE